MSPDPWLVISVATSSADLRELIAAEMVEITGSPVVEEPTAVVAYLRACEDPERAVAEVREQLEAAIADPIDLAISWNWQTDDDWAREWKRGLQPRVVSDRIVVKPTWTDFDPAPGQIVLEIDPQMAFGTGEHATTRGCLRLLDAAMPQGGRVLDLGSGSGILAIAAARLGAMEVIAVECDPDANVNARENLERHAVLAKVTLLEQLADEALLARLGRFDLITANILSSVIRPLLPAFHRALVSTPAAGKLIVSGILCTERDEVLSAANAAGFSLRVQDMEDDWWSALLVPASAVPSA